MSFLVKKLFRPPIFPDTRPHLSLFPPPLPPLPAPSTPDSAPSTPDSAPSIPVPPPPPVHPLHLEFIRLIEGCTGSSESTCVNVSHCWKSHVMAHLLLLSLFVRVCWVMFGPCFVLQYLVSFLVLQTSLDEEERAVCFTLIVFLISCDYWCSVSLPRGVTGLSEVCYCSISWSSCFVHFTQSCIFQDNQMYL